jgi:hypothetical protein
MADRRQQLLQDQRRGLIAPDPELTMQLHRRDPRGVGGHQVGDQNHSASGVRVPCITVPAVTDVWRPHIAHSPQVTALGHPRLPAAT